MPVWICVRMCMSLVLWRVQSDDDGTGMYGSVQSRRARRTHPLPGMYPEKHEHGARAHAVQVIQLSAPNISSLYFRTPGSQKYLVVANPRNPYTPQ